MSAPSVTMRNACGGSDGYLLRGVGLLSVAASLLLATPCPARAGIGVWTIESGPAGGNMSALAIDPAMPATLYAGALNGGGVLKSTDGAAHWASINTGLTNFDFGTTLAIDPKVPATLYAGTAAAVCSRAPMGGRTGRRSTRVSRTSSSRPWRSIPLGPRCMQGPLTACSRFAPLRAAGLMPPS